MMGLNQAHGRLKRYSKIDFTSVLSFWKWLTTNEEDYNYKLQHLQTLSSNIDRVDFIILFYYFRIEL